MCKVVIILLIGFIGCLCNNKSRGGYDSKMECSDLYHPKPINSNIFYKIVCFVSLIF